MYVLNNLWLSQYQQVVITLQVMGPVCKTFTTIICFLKPMTLDHGSHRTVNNQDAFGKKLF